MKKIIVPIVRAMIVASSLYSMAASEALEIGRHNQSDLPKGKETDGIIGDFVLRNATVEAVISGNLPGRRANMSTFYGVDGVTPGCLYDLTLRGQPNDQLTIFAPCDQRGPISYVRIAQTNANAESAIEAVTTAAKGNGLYRRYEYRLRDGWPGVLIVSTLRNESKELLKPAASDRWTAFLSDGVFQGYRWADAVDPADRAGYAYLCPDCPAKGLFTNRFELKPGETRVFTRFLAVGRSPAEAVGFAAAREGNAGRVSAVLTDSSGLPAGHATVTFKAGAEFVKGYADVSGKLEFPFPAGSCEVEISDAGCETVRRQIVIRAGETAELRHQFSPRSGISFEITEDHGREIPCKVQFLGIDGTASPNLGPHNRAHGCLDQYHSETGRFQTPLAPGRYRIVVTHGIEFGHISRQIEVPAGTSVAFRGELKRLVDTPGWVSADYHNHSTPSGDNTCGTDDRIINLAAEQIEFAPTTEHNRLYDWRPHLERLGLTRELNTVSGLELTGSGPHFNSFPFKPLPGEQDNGAPVWHRDPRISAVLLREHQDRDPDRWIQINHPDIVEDFIDRDGDGLADGGYIGLGRLIDAFEVENGIASSILSPYPFRIYTGTTQVVIENRPFVWLQLLNRGHRIVGMAVCDAHSVHGNGVGGWRMYMPSKSDAPAEIDWRENSRHARAGRSILTTGPFLEVRTAEGAGPGSDLRANRGVTLHVRVQCTDWIDIDRVQILVNGRQKPDLNFTRKSHPDWFQNGVVKFEREIRVPLSEDANLIVVAYGENFDLATGYGTSEQARLKPCAFNNPIYVDVDGGGFTPNGDSLDFPLALKKPSLEAAKRLIQGQP